MPFVLVDYIFKFFGFNSTNNLVCEQDYLQWQETMYATFGVQCMVYKGMHRGPTWEYDEEYLDDADLLQQYLMLGH